MKPKVGSQASSFQRLTGSDFRRTNLIY